MTRFRSCLLIFLPFAGSLAFGSDYREQRLEGWTVHVERSLLDNDAERTERAMTLLRDQLQAISRVVPADVVTELRQVPLWLSPEYPGIGPRAEYHPDVDWLRTHGRHPEMAKGIEFTNVAIFEAEVRRMPVFVLHELAHAFHDRVLDFDQAEIKEAYQRAVTSKSYDEVQRHDGRVERAYAMADHKEYFAESTEAFFGRNDFFPFNRNQLLAHDPHMERLLQRLWRVATKPSKATRDWTVQPPPADLKVASCYSKYVDASGYPIVASTNVNDYALKEAAFLVDKMLAKRPDVREAMIASGSRLCILAHNEFTTDLPEFAHLEPKDYWDARARGTGGSETDPYCSCGEENLLGYPGDPYSTECILIHEFAHNIHLRGLVRIDASFDQRLRMAYRSAMDQGLWKGKYASVNHHEYFAEGVQSWFDNNRPPDHDHNHVDTRIELREYDPGLAALCEEVFGDTELSYSKPATRLEGHLAGYNPEQAPRFSWPERLNQARQEIRANALNRAATTEK